MSHSSFRLSYAAGAAALVALAAPAVASAASAPLRQAPALSSAACEAAAAAKSFANVDGDQADYSVAPGGDFEPATTGWTLAGGARVGNGNETLGVTSGGRSVVIPVSGSITSPKFCIDDSHPHFRFAYKIDTIGLTGFMAEVLYETAAGTKAVPLYSSQQVAVSLIGRGWQTSPKSPLATLIPLSGQAATVRVRITGITFGGGNNFVTQTMVGAFAKVGSPLANIGVSIDSVMIDPYRRT